MKVGSTINRCTGNRNLFQNIFLKYIFLVFFIASYSGNSLAQQSIQPLIDKLDSIIVEENIPGAMISIVRADSVLFTGGLGFANIEKQEPVTAEHLFRQGSISKSFTAIAIMQLVEAGKLKLNTPIKEIDAAIPFKNKWANEKPITLEHLLEHTAGFDDMHLHAIFNTTDSAAPPVIQMVQTHKNSLYARWKPGTRMTYSNPGYVVAGHILEKTSREPYSAFLKNEVLLPLGMHASGFYFKSPKQHKMAQGYTNENTEQVFTSIQGGCMQESFVLTQKKWPCTCNTC